MERKHVDFVSSILLLILSVYVIIESIGFYNEINQRMATEFHQSPGFFTFFVGCVLLFCSVLLLIRSLKGGGLATNMGNIKEGATNFLKSPTAIRALIGCSWMGIYIYFLLPTFRFFAASIIFLIVLITFLNSHSFAKMDTKSIAVSVVKFSVISLIAVGFTYVLFNMFFGVPLP